MPELLVGEKPFGDDPPSVTFVWNGVRWLFYEESLEQVEAEIAERMHSAHHHSWRLFAAAAEHAQVRSDGRC